MPTGYTCKIQDGTVVELKDYILDCAKNFGALSYTKEDHVTNIKHREVNDYYLKELHKSYQKLEEIKNMTDEDIENEINRDYNDAIKSINTILDNKKKYKERYLNMLEKVKNWNPPTDEHLSLKEFAITQIEDSLKWDCDDTYIDKEVVKETKEEYRDSRIRFYLKNIEYYSKAHYEEIENVRRANKWIDDLVNCF